MTTPEQAEWLFPNRATRLGSSAYYSCRLSPPPLRDALALLHAWAGEMQRLPQHCSDPGMARLKLAWWREELGRACAGAAEHPLARALGALSRRQGLPAAPFLEMIDAAELQVLRDPPADLAALDRRGERTLGALFELLARCQGVTTDPLLERLRQLGARCSQVYLVRDYGALVRQGHSPLPPQLGGQGGTTEALRHLAGHARAGLAPPLGTPTAVAVRAAILAALLDELARSGFAVLDQRIALTPLRKLWIGWRAARRRGGH
jgi:15-cis-phytoene synthase